jgi:hypothetical protein
MHDGRAQHVFNDTKRALNIDPIALVVHVADCGIFSGAPQTQTPVVPFFASECSIDPPSQEYLLVYEEEEERSSTRYPPYARSTQEQLSILLFALASKDPLLVSLTVYYS